MFHDVTNKEMGRLDFPKDESRNSKFAPGNEK